MRGLHQNFQRGVSGILKFFRSAFCSTLIYFWIRISLQICEGTFWILFWSYEKYSFLCLKIYFVVSSNLWLKFVVVCIRLYTTILLKKITNKILEITVQSKTSDEPISNKHNVFIETSLRAKYNSLKKNR